MNDNKLVQDLEKILHHKLSKEGYAKKLGISVSKVDELFVILKQNRKTPVSTRKIDNEKGTIETTIVTSFEPKNDVELAKLHKIDLAKYVIKNYWSKVLPSGKFTSSVFARLKQPEDYTPEDFCKFLETYSPNYKAAPKVLMPFSDLPSVNVELSISDFHLAKRQIDGDNTPSKRAQRFFNAAFDLITKVNNCYSINTVVFPISNDFFHTDNYQNQTTNRQCNDLKMTLYSLLHQPQNLHSLGYQSFLQL